MKRRLLALLLVLAMLLPMIPMGTLAEEVDEQAAMQSNAGTGIVSVTAEDTSYEDWTMAHVSVDYTIDPRDVESIEHVRIVAAAYEGRKMIASDYVEVEPKAVDTQDLYLAGVPMGTSVQVLLLDQDNNALSGNRYATWGQPEEPEQGWQGNISWSLGSNGTLILQGNNCEMVPYDDGYSWAYLADKVTAVVMDGVTNVSQGAFYGFSRLMQITLGDACTSIGYGAFMGCESLEMVNGSVSFVGQQAFEGCQALRILDMTACTMVDDYAFNGCKSLDVNLEAVKVLGYGAFMNSGIQVAYLPNLEGDVADYAFLNCQNLISVTLPEDGTHNIGEAAFAHSGMEMAWFPGGVQMVGPHAFEGCQALSTVTFSNGLESIGESAFQDSTLSEIVLPESLKEIGDNAFAGIQTLKVYDDTKVLDRIKDHIGTGNDVLFAKTEETVEEQETLETEETVPEETVPETAEEIPEETAEEAEEALTSEEAASEGYYVAPEGAELQENVELEEMAAFSGTDKTSRGVHTASFTGLAPQKLYILIVSKVPGSLDGDDLKYIDMTASDAGGNAEISYIPKDEGSAIVQLYGPEKLALGTEQEYITLKPGEDVRLQFTSNQDVSVNYYYESDVTEALDVEVRDDGFWHVSIREGYRPTEVETKYLTFYAYGTTSAAVKIRVDLIPEDDQVLDATLGETAVTHNYYSSEATPIPVFLKIDTPDQRSTVATQAAFDAAENTGFIRDVAFSDGTPEDVKNAFEIRVQDDHTLLLTTKMTAENAADGGNINLGSIAKSLKSSYTNVGFRLTVVENGQEKQIQVTGTLKLTVQKKLPTLKANTVTLNTYAQPTGTVTITGGEIEALKCEGTDLVALVYNEENGTVTAQLRESTTKSSTQNLTAQVLVEGYNQPVTVKVPVKIDAKAPTLKLEKTNLNLCSIAYPNESISIMSTTKGMEVSDLLFGGCTIQDAKGNDLSASYNAYISDGVLNLYSITTDRPLGKQNLVITTSILAFYQDGGEYVAIETPVSFKLTVNNVEPTLKLNKSSLVLNAGVLAGVPIKATITGIPEDVEYGVKYFIQGDNYLKDELEAGKYFDLAWDGAEALTLMPNYYKIYPSEYDPEFDPNYDIDAFLGDTYTLHVGIDGVDQDKWAEVRFTLTQEEPRITRLKSSGTIDLNNDDTRVTLTPTYSDKQSVASVDVTVTDAEGVSHSVVTDMDGENILIGRAAGEEKWKPGTYTAKVNIWWGGGIPSTEPTVTTTFKVVEKKPTLKVTGKLDSGKEDSALYVTSSYKHNVIGIWGDAELQTPEVILLSGGQPVDDALYNVEFEGSGRIKITPNVFGEELLKAGKYTLQLTFGDKELVQTANITVSQTVPKLKIFKSSLILHPAYTDSIYFPSSYTGLANSPAVQVYQANGKDLWGEDELINVAFDPDNYVSVQVVGEAPEKDTTLKVKLIPDSRISNKFTWLTVKVLGGKSLQKKATLKVLSSLDPANTYHTTGITVAINGIDNPYFENGTITLLESTDKGRNYHEVDPEAYKNSFANGTYAYLNISDKQVWDGNGYKWESTLDPNNKYRVQVSYGNGTIIGTADVKVAYGKNKFTVAKAPTLYKQDYKAQMDVHIDQQDMGQLIDNVTIKGNSNFSLEPVTFRSGNGKNDWILKYTGDLAKLKTTTLTLQIFLKGNKTNKPNATMSLKVTVK